MIGNILIGMFVAAFVLFFAGGVAREINMESQAPPPEVDNNARREYEKRAITRRPLLPNIMIVSGLILIFGTSATLLGTFLNWNLAAIGTGMVVTGYYWRRKKVNSRKKTDTGALGHSE